MPRIPANVLNQAPARRQVEPDAPPPDARQMPNPQGRELPTPWYHGFLVAFGIGPRSHQRRASFGPGSLGARHIDAPPALLGAGAGMHGGTSSRAIRLASAAEKVVIEGSRSLLGPSHVRSDDLNCLELKSARDDQKKARLPNDMWNLVGDKLEVEDAGRVLIARYEGTSSQENREKLLANCAARLGFGEPPVTLAKKLKARLGFGAPLAQHVDVLYKKKGKNDWGGGVRDTRDRTLMDMLSPSADVERSLRYADKYPTDRLIVLAAVKQHRWALYYASPELKADKEVVLAAVKKDGWALEYASPELKEDKEVVLAAVKQYGRALYHASPKLKEDKEVVLAARRVNV